LLLFEEFQDGLGRDERTQFARLLSQVRWKHCSAWFINQQPAQIAAVDPILLKLLRTNVATEMLYRTAYEDAKAMAHAMPADRPRNGQRGAGTREDAIEQLTRLKQRELLVWPKERAHAHLCRSPRLDLDALRALADRVPQEIRERIRAGTVSVPADELRATLARESNEREAPSPEAPDFLRADRAADDLDGLDLG
jgi:hypothetical protein